MRNYAKKLRLEDLIAYEKEFTHKNQIRFKKI